MHAYGHTQPPAHTPTHPPTHPNPYNIDINHKAQKHISSLLDWTHSMGATTMRLC
jgi:hypothetical protein